MVPRILRDDEVVVSHREMRLTQSGHCEPVRETRSPKNNAEIAVA